MLSLVIFPFLPILRCSPAHYQYRQNYTKSSSRNPSAGHPSAGEYSSIPIWKGSSILDTQGVYHSSQALYIFLLRLQYLPTLSPVGSVPVLFCYISQLPRFEAPDYQIVLLWNSSCPNSHRST